MKPLTAMQQRVLDVIVSYVARNGYPPTVREVAEAVSRQHSTVARQLDQLVLKGRIERMPGKSRAIRVKHLEGA